MNKIVNYNELRKLAAKQIKKFRPILSTMLIKDGKAYYTDGLYLVVMDGYEGSPDMLVDLNDYSARNTIEQYPNLTNIMSGDFGAAEFEEAIYEGEVIHQHKRNDGLIIYIDDAIKEQLQRLIIIKNYDFSPEKIKITSRKGLLEIEHLGSTVKLYFMLKVRAKL